MYGKKLVPVRGTVYKLFKLQSVSIILNLQSDCYSRFFQNINMHCALIGLCMWDDVVLVKKRATPSIPKPW